MCPMLSYFYELFITLFLFVSTTDAVLCYKCFSDSDNSTCVLQPRTFSWSHCEGQCQVWRLYSEADSSIYMFERSCSPHCRNGCTQLADMEHRFVGCSFCCGTNFCNAVNSVVSVLSYSVINVAFFIVLYAHQLFA